jgi:hypothetical protein
MAVVIVIIIVVGRKLLPIPLIISQLMHAMGEIASIAPVASRLLPIPTQLCLIVTWARPILLITGIFITTIVFVVVVVERKLLPIPLIFSQLQRAMGEIAISTPVASPSSPVSTKLCLIVGIVPRRRPFPYVPRVQLVEVFRILVQVIVIGESRIVIVRVFFILRLRQGIIKQIDLIPETALARLPIVLPWLSTQVAKLVTTSAKNSQNTS